MASGGAGRRRQGPAALALLLALLQAAEARAAARPLAPASPLALVSVASPADTARSEPPEVALGAGGIGADKYQHVSLAAAIGIGAGIATRSNAAALVTPLVLGFAKEIRDRRHTRFDPADLAADAVGALIALAVTAAVVH